MPSQNTIIIREFLIKLQQVWLHKLRFHLIWHRVNLSYFHGWNCPFVGTVLSSIEENSLRTQEGLHKKEFKACFDEWKKTLAEVYCSRRRLLWSRCIKFWPVNWYLFVFCHHDGNFLITGILYFKSWKQFLENIL